MSSAIQSIHYPINAPLQEVVSAILYNEVCLERDGFIDLFPIGSSVLSFSLDRLPLYFNNSLVSQPYNLTGQLTQHFRMKAVEGIYRTVMFILKPYGAYRIFNCAQHPLQNNYFPVEFLDSEFRPYANQLQHLEDPQTCVELVSRWIGLKLKQTSTDSSFLNVKRILDETDFQKHTVRVEDLTVQYGSSKITFERNFKKITGLLPKQYISIARFNAAYFLIQASSTKTWLDVVSRLEYFDQSHFIKEFKRYCGLTPSKLHLSICSIAGHVNQETQTPY